MPLFPATAHAHTIFGLSISTVSVCVRDATASSLKTRIRRPRFADSGPRSRSPYCHCTPSCRTTPSTASIVVHPAASSPGLSQVSSFIRPRLSTESNLEAPSLSSTLASRFSHSGCIFGCPLDLSSTLTRTNPHRRRSSVSYLAMSVSGNDHVEIMSNDRGNRATPTSRSTTTSVALQENQVTMNSRLLGRKFEDSEVQADMKYFQGWSPIYNTATDTGHRLTFGARHDNAKRYAANPLASRLRMFPAVVLPGEHRGVSGVAAHTTLASGDVSTSTSSAPAQPRSATARDTGIRESVRDGKPV
ncbi:hypothetical protein DFH07DRAFT_957590 [Mycena maculata]|uniref:Uncharacterized protein n=1 Tax=Mycena maculata TaxID=230809 RepID=A0AAD7J9K8_9AGAR|nr:hypothetical protein DFH07DRAFT_957590 [Mycena maculata]